MSGIKYEVLAGDDLISALRGGRTGDLLDDAAYAAADEIERLQRVLQKIMARCADLLDEDQFNELDAMTRATVTASVVDTPRSPPLSSGDAQEKDDQIYSQAEEGELRSMPGPSGVDHFALSLLRSLRNATGLGEVAAESPVPSAGEAPVHWY